MMIPVKAFNQPDNFTHFAVTNSDATVAVYTEPYHLHVADGYWDEVNGRLAGCESKLSAELIDQLSTALREKIGWEPLA